MVWKLEFYCQILLNYFVVKTQLFQTFTLLYLTLLVYLELWLWIKFPKPKREEVESIWKYERQRLQKLYTQGVAAYGSVRDLVKASNLKVAKARQFLYSKASYKKLILATRQTKRMKALARFRKEIWCLGPAYVDQLAKDNNYVKYLLYRQDLFDRTVDAKGLKTKASKGLICAFWPWLQKNRPKNLWVDKGTEFAGYFRRLSKAEGIQAYSKMSETKAAFSERTIRSLKKYFTVTWKNRVTSTFIICLTSLQPSILEKIVR